MWSDVLLPRNKYFTLSFFFFFFLALCFFFNLKMFELLPAPPPSTTRAHTHTHTHLTPSNAQNSSFVELLDSLGDKFLVHLDNLRQVICKKAKFMHGFDSSTFS